jgi:integrase
MKARLTKTMIDTATPGDQDRYLWDGKNGLGLRIKPTGSKIFVYQFRDVSRRSHRIAIDRYGTITLEQARRTAADFAAMVRRGEDPARARVEQRQALTVRDLVAVYESAHLSKRRASTQASYRSILRRHILPRLGSCLVAEVTRTDLERFHLALRRQPYQGNRVLALASVLFGLAVDKGWRTDNPARGVEPFDEEQRDRWLDDAELARLVSALESLRPRPAALALLLVLYTGSRRGEVLRAEWRQFDLRRQLWIKPSHATKQKRIERLPLAPATVALLRELAAKHKPGDRYIFGATPVVDVRKTWRRALSIAGLEDFRVHDIRHCFASHAVSSGRSESVAGGVLGHSSPLTTRRYSHLADKAKADTVDWWADKLARLSVDAEDPDRAHA